MFVVYNTETGWSDESMRFESHDEAVALAEDLEERRGVSYAIRREL